MPGSATIPGVYLYQQPDSGPVMAAQLGIADSVRVVLAQVALASDCTRMAVMRAMYKSVCRVYSVSPWSAENTMCAVYAIAHHQPCTQCVAVKKLLHWLFRHAKWHGTEYTDTTIPTELQPEGYEPSWCTDIHLLRASSACLQHDRLNHSPCLCVALGGST